MGVMKPDHFERRADPWVYPWQAGRLSIAAGFGTVTDMSLQARLQHELLPRTPVAAGRSGPAAAAVAARQFRLPADLGGRDRLREGGAAGHQPLADGLSRGSSSTR